MVIWGDVKKTRNKINIEDVIKDLQVKAKQQKDPDFLKIMKEQKKEEREFRRKEKLERILLYTDSYLNPDQFDYLRTEIKSINDSVFNHCNMLDEIELKII